VYSKGTTDQTHTTKNKKKAIKLSYLLEEVMGAFFAPQGQHYISYGVFLPLSICIVCVGEGVPEKATCSTLFFFFHTVDPQ